MPEHPEKAKKYKNQIHLRLGEDIVTALENKATQEGMTVTALVIKYMKQGLGWEQQSSLNTDIAEIEERVLERVLERISQIDEVALEEQLYKRVSEHVSQDWINYATNLEVKIHKSISERVSPPEAVVLEQSSDNDIDSVSSTDTDRYTKDSMPTKPIEVAPTTQVAEENTPSSLMPLFGSINEGQIAALPDLVRYLNQVVDPNAEKPWNREKLRLFKKKLLTYLKKPLDKRQGDPPCPVIINDYLLDWVPTKDEPIHSYGRQWWIQLLPKDSETRNQLVSTRRKPWEIHEQQ